MRSAARANHERVARERRRIEHDEHVRGRLPTQRRDRVAERVGHPRAHRDDTVGAYRKAVERAIGHMKQNLAEPLDLDELAGVAATSKFHLVRVFDEMTGTTPRHFLACLRMQRAKELLLAQYEIQFWNVATGREDLDRI